MSGSNFVLRAGSWPRLRSCGSRSYVHSSASARSSLSLGDSVPGGSSSSRGASQPSLSSCSQEALQQSFSCWVSWHRADELSQPSEERSPAQYSGMSPRRSEAARASPFVRRDGGLSSPRISRAGPVVQVVLEVSDPARDEVGLLSVVGKQPWRLMPSTVAPPGVELLRRARRDRSGWVWSPKNSRAMRIPARAVTIQHTCSGSWNEWSMTRLPSDVVPVVSASAAAICVPFAGRKRTPTTAVHIAIM